MSFGQHEASHLEVDLGRSSSHTQAKSRCINATVTFPKDEELIFSEIGKLGEETLQGSVIIGRDLEKQQIKSRFKDSLQFLSQ